MRCKMQSMNLLRNKGRGMVCSATAVTFVLIAATAGVAAAASLDGSERDARRADIVQVQAAPARITPTVWVGLANPYASDRTPVAEPSVASQPVTDDQDRPSPGAMVLAVLGLALWVGARLRRQD